MAITTPYRAMDSPSATKIMDLPKLLGSSLVAAMAAGAPAATAIPPPVQPAPVAQPAAQAQPKPEVKPQPKPVEQKPESEGLTVRFALAKAVVTEDEAAKIAAFAQWLKTHPKAKAEITGYADAGTGNTGINSNLSRQRVQAVAKILTQKHGIPASRIKTAYKGDTVQPFAANDDNRVVIGTAVEK